MIDKEMVDSIKDAIDSLGMTTYGGAWDSALVDGVNGERYHAITNDNDVVVRADGDNRHSSWLCDYLELVSPVNMLKLIAQLEAAQKENANDNKLKYIRRLEAELSAANEKLSKPVVLPELKEAVEFYLQVRKENPPSELGVHKDADEWLKRTAIKAAGFTVEGNADVE